MIIQVENRPPHDDSHQACGSPNPPPWCNSAPDVNIDSGLWILLAIGLIIGIVITEKRNDIMIDKKYLDRLKEDDYIAWAELENDPLVVGQNTGGGVILVIVALLIVIGTAFLLFF